MVCEALEDIQELIDTEQLLTRDIYRDLFRFKKRKTVVKRSVCILHTTATLPVVTALRKKESIMAAVL